jgi:uncharacterized cupin superfamily protein
MTEGGGFVCQALAMNVWDDEWGPQEEDWSGGGAVSKRLVPRGPLLGASVYELGPGNFMVFHFHHGSEELLLVLRGRPTLRTADGERQLDEGEVVHFPQGPDGAHGFRNDTDGTVRCVVFGTRVSPEVVEYPDLGQVTAQSRLPSHRGEPLFLIHDLGEESA